MPWLSVPAVVCDKPYLEATRRWGDADNTLCPEWSRRGEEPGDALLQCCWKGVALRRPTRPLWRYREALARMMSTIMGMEDPLGCVCAPLYRSGTDVCMCARGSLEVNLLADNLRADQTLRGSEVGEGRLGPVFSGRGVYSGLFTLGAVKYKSSKKSQSNNFKSLWRSVECGITFRIVRNGSFHVTYVCLYRNMKCRSCDLFNFHNSLISYVDIFCLYKEINHNDSG